MLTRGPLAPEAIFSRAWKRESDIVAAMYHDQGHIASKMVGFEDAVNVTAGLPIVRTSVDHGTAFDIAGKNKANPRNMRRAISRAVQLARTQATP